MKRALRDAKTVLEWVAEGHTADATTRAIMESCAEGILKQAPFAAPRKPPKKALPFMPRKAAKRAKAATRRERVGEIREAVFKRAGEVCEHAGCHSRATDLDHELGGANRRALESIGTCRALCWTCHRLKTDNVPSRFYWASDFARHCARHGYPVPSRVAAELAAAEAQP